MAAFTVPDAYRDLAPLIITSPTTRCGTTLVQRLISSSENAFIYGEEIGNQFKVLTDQFLTVMSHCEANGAALDLDFRRALEGSLADWRPGLAPPAEVLRQAWIQIYYTLPRILASFGEAIDRPIWGFKWPACPPTAVKVFMSLLPSAKVVYVTRNPLDALKSAKARRFVTTTPQAAAFCADWSANVEGLLPLRGHPRVLWLSYEDLMADQEGTIARLQGFVGALNMSPDVFGVKVNTFVGDASGGHSPTQYIEPADLTEAEIEALKAHAGAALRPLYPDLRLPGDES
jgi:hypothetical protein